MVHGWGTCRDSWSQVHRHGLQFCHNPVFLFLFLHPLRHAEMADVEKWRRLFHSSRVKLPLVKMSASWCLVSMYLVWILGSKINPIKQPVQNNPVVSWHMSHCRTPAFDYHLNHGFIVLKDKKHSTKLRGSHGRRNVINIIEIQIDVLGWILVFHVECGVSRQVSLWLLTFGFVDLVWWSMKYFNHQTPKIKRGNSVHA